MPLKHDGYICKIIPCFSARASTEEGHDALLDPYPQFLFRKSKDQVFNHCTISEKRSASTGPIKVCGDLANSS